MKTTPMDFKADGKKNRLRHARNETFLQLNTLTKMANGGK